MSIEKLTKNILQHENIPYSIVSNLVINNIKNTSALGVYVYLASKPAGWVISKKHLQNHFECGRDHINSCWRHLTEIGALEVNPIRNDKGQITEWITVLKSTINTLDPTRITQNVENPYSGENDTPDMRITQNVENPHCGKSAPIKDILLVNKEREEKDSSSSRSIPHPARAEIREIFSAAAEIISEPKMELVSQQLTDNVSLITALPSNYNPHYVKTQVLEDEECNQIFKEKNLNCSERPTLSEEFDYCVEHRRLKNRPTGLREFRQWLSMARGVIVQPASPQRVLSIEDNEIVLDYKHWKRMGENPAQKMGEIKALRAEKIIHKMNEVTKNKKNSPIEIRSNKPKSFKDILGKNDFVNLL